MLRNGIVSRKIQNGAKLTSMVKWYCDAVLFRRSNFSWPYCEIASQKPLAKTTFICLAVFMTLALAQVACKLQGTATDAPPRSTLPAVVQPTQAQPPVNTATVSPAPADGATLLDQSCTLCHSLERVKSKRLSADEWSTIVARMVRKGAKLTSDEQKTLVDYLAKTYGP